MPPDASCEFGNDSFTRSSALAGAYPPRNTLSGEFCVEKSPGAKKPGFSIPSCALGIEFSAAFEAESLVQSGCVPVLISLEEPCGDGSPNGHHCGLRQVGAVIAQSGPTEERAPFFP